MNIDELRKTTKEKPAFFMLKKWCHYDCDMTLLEDNDSFDKLKGKDKLMLAYVNNASEFGTIVKWFFPLSDYSFEAIVDYELSRHELDYDIDSLSPSNKMSLIRRVSLSCLPILMQKVAWGGAWDKAMQEVSDG